MTDGMHTVVCERCATTVLVAKNSLAQTSIQWRGDAGALCAELAARRAAGEQTALVAVCTALRESIERAVHSGAVPVPDG